MSDPLPPLAVTGIDHIYLAVSDLARAQAFYDLLLGQVLGFRRKDFDLGGEPHSHYYNRHFGYVLRPARQHTTHHSYAPGLHHLCLRLAEIAEVQEAARRLQAAGLEVSPATHYPEYAHDYWACHLRDPDGLRLEITNYREERRYRHEHWDEL